MWRVAHPTSHRGLLSQDNRSGRGAGGYPKWAWFLAALTLFPLIPMAIGKFIPRTRKYLGALGVFGGSVALVVLLVIVIAVSVSGEDSSQKVRRADPASTTSDIVIPADVKTVILTAIQQNQEVVDAAIEQDGSDVSLVLVVRSFTSEDRAKELSDNFVRLTKTLSPDTVPGRTIGQGIYSYLVGVYYSDETQIVLGAKVRSSDRITW